MLVSDGSALAGFSGVVFCKDNLPSRGPAQADQDLRRVNEPEL